MQACAACFSEPAKRALEFRRSLGDSDCDTYVTHCHPFASLRTGSEPRGTSSGRRTSQFRAAQWEEPTTGVLRPEERAHNESPSGSGSNKSTLIGYGETPGMEVPPVTRPGGGVKKTNNLSQRRKDAKNAKYNCFVFLARSATLRLCVNCFCIFKEFFTPSEGRATFGLRLSRALSPYLRAEGRLFSQLRTPVPRPPPPPPRGSPRAHGGRARFRIPDSRCKIQDARDPDEQRLRPPLVGPPTLPRLVYRRFFPEG